MIMEGNDRNPFLNSMRASLTRPPSWVISWVFFAVLIILTIQITNKSVFQVHPLFFGFSDEQAGGIRGGDDTAMKTCSGFFKPVPERKVVKSIVEFGGVGDGKTSNTASFRAAMADMERFKGSGGATLIIPKGIWLTGSFNLTSNFTLFLEEGSVILGSQDPSEWPIVEPLPSYGRGRERLGGRHISLLHGNNLTNVAITGQNGTIDGQGKMWWDQWWNRTLENTRGHLLELINSHNVLISNLTFRNSPFWTIHPVYCSNVVVKNMTVLAPLNAPNTDGIDPDSSTNVCIEDCYVESGDDLVAVKSGWDQYGIAIARPSSNIVIRRVSGTTPTCSGLGIGSEMSGGISNITVEDMHIRNSAAGVRIKTDQGRGGYIENVTINNIYMENVKIPLRFSRGANDHPDDGWNPKALPKIKGIVISNVVSSGTKKPPLLEGIQGSPAEGICMKNVSILGLSPSLKWHCEYVSGFSFQVFPEPCDHLRKNDSTFWCSSNS
ncbi:OLC1v1008615C1 [Oldenlandia corymbosa var. corymbosa]|uniref:OLC1v1008615C1 n=1 Tax=Oldenlandia corymbosa var. corymbosa TaxID=529605 RepID=A0AAV1DME1_OLDCO|nr:OLC1v1008615C1 [Oldenlandia corymbosa var. corymbosa]